MESRRNRPSAEVLVGGSVIFATAGQVIIKLGLEKSVGLWCWLPHALPAPLTLGVIGGLLIYGIGTVLWIAAISRSNVSYLYPLASLNYVLIALCGHFLLHEPLLTGRWIGIGIMAAGIVLLARVAPRPETA